MRARACMRVYPHQPPCLAQEQNVLTFALLLVYVRCFELLAMVRAAARLLCERTPCKRDRTSAIVTDACIVVHVDDAAARWFILARR